MVLVAAAVTSTSKRDFYEATKKNKWQASKNTSTTSNSNE